MKITWDLLAWDDVCQNQPQHVFTVEESTKLIIQISETFIFASTTEHTFKAQIMLYLILGKSIEDVIFVFRVEYPLFSICGHVQSSPVMILSWLHSNYCQLFCEPKTDTYMMLTDWHDFIDLHFLKWQFELEIKSWVKSHDAWWFILYLLLKGNRWKWDVPRQTKLAKSDNGYIWVFQCQSIYVYAFVYEFPPPLKCRCKGLSSE